MAFVLVCNAALFAPVEIFRGNAVEFSVPLAPILLVYLLPALVVVLLAASIGALISPGPFRRYLVLLAALAVLTWAQGTFLVWDYGVLDGSPIHWLEGWWRGAIDTSLWLLVLLGTYLGYRRFERPVILAAAASFLIQLVALLPALFSSEAVAANGEARVLDRGAYAAMSQFSSNGNVLHIVMDGFQSDIFSEIVADPEYDWIADTLTGFTFFDQHTGTFPYTQMTIPLIVSGKTYRNEVPIDDFTAAAMRGDTILNAAAAAGYEIDIASQAALVSVYSMGEFTNRYDIPANRHTARRHFIAADAIRLADLSLFRVTPHFLKAYIYQDDLWFLQSLFRDASYLQMRYFAELDFLGDMAANIQVVREVPVYKLFHLMLSHRPTVGNANCEFDGVLRTNRANVRNQARCGLIGVVRLLQAMKESGIYDRSLIVLMADHGAWVGAKSYSDRYHQNKDKAGRLAPGMAAMALPVLAVKPAGASDPFRVSPAPTSIGDVATTISELLRLEANFGGHNVYGIDEDAARTRIFYDYAYGKNTRNPGYLWVMAEYEINGSPLDPDAWRRTGTLRPGGDRMRAHSAGSPGNQ